MRIRTILTTCAAALLFAGLSPSPTAAAGTGASRACSDGVGNEIVVDDTVVTVAVQADPNEVWLCYSTAGEGVDGQFTGGKIEVTYAATVLGPSAQTTMNCSPDYQSGIAPVCRAYAFAITNSGTVVVTPYPDYVCVLYIGSLCQAYAPGATVSTTSTTPLVEVGTFGVYAPVTVPGNCVSLFVTPCP